MASKNVNIAQLSDAMADILETYADDVADAVDNAADSVSKQCLNDIKANAPKNTGVYKKSWKRKKTSQGRGKVGYTCYSTKPGLPHLLEHGHAKVNGGSVQGKPHIAPAEEKANADFEQKCKEAIGNA